MRPRRAAGALRPGGPNKMPAQRPAFRTEASAEKDAQHTFAGRLASIFTESRTRSPIDHLVPPRPGRGRPDGCAPWHRGAACNAASRPFGEEPGRVHDLGSDGRQRRRREGKGFNQRTPYLRVCGSVTHVRLGGTPGRRARTPSAPRMRPRFSPDRPSSVYCSRCSPLPRSPSSSSMRSRAARMPSGSSSSGTRPGAPASPAATAVS